jgi:hypothetical protein
MRRIRQKAALHDVNVDFRRAFVTGGSFGYTEERCIDALARGI